MDVISNWHEVKSFFKSAFSSSFHFAIATVNENGEPHVTPIGSFNLSLTIATLLLTGTANSESYTAHKNHSYHVDFSNPQSQFKALSNVQQKIDNKANNEELKIILFGKGQALSLDANTLNNTKIEYGKINKAVKKKMTKLNRKGVRFIICKNPTSRKRHYSTNQAATTVEQELQSLKSQGYNCN
ncbi:hypothetical protein MNBD_GAMMA06-1212 [hydrothermal vent metagenome]|uniref:Uncharacterized protein n=1 Tax=hydrothermal vent metagenome TaxID=652676 RepID=A0A3B0WTF7_9ZZZZ